MSQKIKTVNQMRLSLLQSVMPRMLIGLFAMITAAAIQLSVPSGIAKVIDQLEAGTAFTWIVEMAGLASVACVVYCSMSALRYFMFESSGNIMLANLREQLHKALLAHDISFFDKSNVGELTSRLTSDVETLRQSLSMGSVIALRSVILLLGCTAMMVYYSWSMSLFVALLIPLSLMLAKRLGKAARERSFALQDAQAASLKRAQEDYVNIRIIHAFDKQEHAFGLFRQANGNALQTANSNTGLFAMFQGLSTFVTFSTLIGVLAVGSQFVSDNVMSVGELTSFIMYSAMAASSSMALAGCWGEWMRAYGATQRVFDMIKSVASQSSETPDEARITGSVSAPICFNDVTFHYPSRPHSPALKRLNLTINEGDVVALVGNSGAGKSTVANLLLKLYEPDSGKLTFNGIDSQVIAKSALRNSCVLVEQEPSLFSGSIADNIRFAARDNCATQSDIINVAKLANAHQFIVDLPDGYETEVGDRGVQLSGGQKQRIAIARALLRNPKILILDEATSALDNDSERLVQGALANLMEGRTTIIIAHRLSTIMQANTVVVLADGEIVQQGGHSELSRQTGSFYHRLVSSQLQTMAG